MINVNTSNAQSKPLRLGVQGLTHGHVGWILGRQAQSDIVMVGIAEKNKALALRLSKEYGFSMDLVYDSLDEMIEKSKPDIMVAFGDIYEHLNVVASCAPKGIHIMVEKPLAVNLEHAKKMEALAKEHQIELLTNYETSWYPTNVKAKEALDEGTIGQVRKVIVRDGHKGFTDLKLSEEFLEWLTDPVLNGGGAITDFGCYGANLLTWLHRGKRPISVTAVTHQLQPNANPKVDDDATIIIKYDTSMAILEPSWNWPIGRKDMEIYGTKGVAYADNRNQFRVRISEGYDGFTEETFELEERTPPYNDPFALFAAVVNGSVKLEPYDPYSLENNMIAMEILEAAVKSAQSQETISFK